MTWNEIIKQKLEPALQECQLHKRRLDYALDKLRGNLPLTAAHWISLDDQTVTHIDQLRFRYSRLQDAMGQRLFPAILHLAGEWRDNEAFIDKLNHLEKFGAIPASEEWNQIRMIHNCMTNEYPDAPEQNSENLNFLVDSISSLENTLTQAETFAKNLATRVTTRRRNNEDPRFHIARS